MTEAEAILAEIVAAKRAHDEYRNTNTMFDLARVTQEQRDAHALGFARTRIRLWRALAARRDWRASERRRTGA